MRLLILVAMVAAAAATGPGLSVEHMDPTLPPALPAKTPDCTIHILQHDFSGADVGTSAEFTQPEACPAPWTRVVLELSATASDVQENRVASVWIDGAEILRTATPLSLAPGAFWTVHKDVTRHTALLRRLSNGGAVTMMLDNTTTAGSYTANLSLHFYRGWVRSGSNSLTARPTVKGLYRHPADVILPVSHPDGNATGYWFRIDDKSTTATSSISIPRNTYRAVLEIFASYHADDEFWYGNPLRNSYDDGGSGGKANGGYRQAYVTIDGKFVGGHVPFPVIYPGSINPYFWSPVTAIGAFDLPSYDLDITPFLSLLLDGGAHEIALGVRDGLPYWLLTANLHLWVDHWSNTVEAGLIEYNAREPAMNRHAEWRSGDGSSEVGADGLTRFKGWVSSSHGNLTTEVRQKVTFKSQVAVQNGGAARRVEMVNQVRTTIDTHRGNVVVERVRVFTEAPLQVQTSASAVMGGVAYETTRLSHQMMETAIVTDGPVVTTTAMNDRQDAEGAAMVRDGVVVWGSGSLKSNYKFTDEGTCYLRTVNVEGGVVMVDTSSPSCIRLASA